MPDRAGENISKFDFLNLSHCSTSAIRNMRECVYCNSVTHDSHIEGMCRSLVEPSSRVAASQRFEVLRKSALQHQVGLHLWRAFTRAGNTTFPHKACTEKTQSWQSCWTPVHHMHKAQIFKSLKKMFHLHWLLCLVFQKAHMLFSFFSLFHPLLFPLCLSCTFLDHQQGLAWRSSSRVSFSCMTSKWANQLMNSKPNHERVCVARRTQHPSTLLRLIGSLNNVLGISQRRC